MRIGDKVVLIKDVTHDNGVLNKGSEWIVSNLIEHGKERYVVLSNDSSELFAVKKSSVKKVK